MSHQSVQKSDDLSEQLSELAAQALSRAYPKKLGFYFDYRGPTFDVASSLEPLHAIAHPLLTDVIDGLASGCIFFSTDVQMLDFAHASVKLQIALMHTPADESSLRKLMAAARATADESLTASSPVQDAVRHSVHQICESLSGALVIGGLVDGCQIVQASFHLPCPPYPCDQTAAVDQGLLAWLIGSPSFALEPTVRRLHRMGWSIKLFPSVKDAQAHLGQVPPNGIPDVVIGTEKCQVCVSELAQLGLGLPQSTALFATTLPNEEPHTASIHFADRVQLVRAPLSPKQLHQMSVVALAKSRRKMLTLSRSQTTLERRPRALLVEDNHINQLLSTEILNHFGFDVDIAIHGLQAVEHCLRELPDIIIMDIDMPVMNGLEATEQIRSLEGKGRLPYIPIIAVTAYDTPAYRSAAQAAGLDAFVSKPVDIALLRKAIQCALDEGKGKARSAPHHSRQGDPFGTQQASAPSNA